MSLRPPKTAAGAAVDPSENRGGWGGDSLEEARETVMAVMRGRGGRNAQARLLAAKTVLARDFLEHLSDDALAAELRRRAGTGA